jgi:hypothetical protein
MDYKCLVFTLPDKTIHILAMSRVVEVCRKGPQDWIIYWDAGKQVVNLPIKEFYVADSMNHEIDFLLDKDATNGAKTPAGQGSASTAGPG